jgi:predicted nucleic acid-binding protein
MLPPAGEALVSVAIEFLDAYTRGEMEIVVPDLFWAECGNVLWRAIRTRRCSQFVAENSFGRLRSYGFITAPTFDLIEQAFAIATTFERTVYDSLYVAVAAEYGIRLLTADEKLVSALGGKFPVKWLGTL